MTTRPGLLLIPFAAVCVIAAACATDLAGPDGEAHGVRGRRATATADSGAACSDSVMAGYGTCCTGGIEYTQFEYDPATGTEYVCSEDPDAACKGLTYTTTCDTSYTPPPPPPPPAPTSPSPTPTSPTPTR